MSEVEKQRILYALKAVAQAVEKGQVEEFEIAWQDNTLLESFKFAPNGSTEFPQV